MGKQPYRKSRAHPPPVINLIVNSQARDYARDKVSFLISELKKNNIRYHISEPDSTKTAAYYVRSILGKKPFGIVACGGDGTVNLIARYLLRRRSNLGILPLGKDNNIYRSLYGEVDLKEAVRHICSRKNRKIDGAMASGKFFLGSIGFGLIPEIAEELMARKPPRFAISWSRLVSQAAAAVRVRPFMIKIDSFQFDLSPIIFSVNLLTYSATLPLVPSCLPDDGRGEVVFDVAPEKTVLSAYIRQIYKKKYTYSDQIRMYRGEKISVSPVKGLKFYIDGDLIDFPHDELSVEVYPQKIRIFQAPSS